MDILYVFGVRQLVL